MGNIDVKPLIFLGGSLKDLRRFPKSAREKMGHELHLVQTGETPTTAKPLKGLPGVMELAKKHDTDTFRAVYTANLGDAIFVLHCFKKKAKKRIKTPKTEMDVIRQRLKEAKKISKGE
ncbi:MAG: type II toxin-antitoxin system RelE/ParE family toxin [Nitrospinae bacterium]|nr:type II toxin-antitoxin system RelE/ParE family toxin [Nitrospinota bacterium]